jgi:SAM-dependent methyltransferase
MSHPPDQTEIFSRDEGDNWFSRNEAGLNALSDDDRITRMVLRWAKREPVNSVCELGCSNGSRLAALGRRLQRVRRLAGSDVSKRAIEGGRKRWPMLELFVGSLDEPHIDGSFDLVIVSFVFHWVARQRLSESVAGVDALVRDGGALILADFLPDRPCARRYHHRPDAEIYTYKQDYSRCFTGLGTYVEIEREIFSHSGKCAAMIDPQDRAMCSLLRKNLENYESANPEERP